MQNSARLKAVAASLTDLEALLITDPIDLFYLTGLDVSLGSLFIFKKERPVFCVDGRYEEACCRQQVVDVRLWEGKAPLPVALPSRVGFDRTKTTVATYERYCQLAPVSWIPLDAPIAQQRIVKDDEEIALLAEAAALGSLGFDFVKETLREGVTEKELALELEIFWLRAGGEGLAFEPIIAFGENSSRPHHRASNRILRQGECVLIDIGVKWKHYHSDMTRVLFFGDVDPKLPTIYQCVKEAAEKAYLYCRPGISVGEIDAVARDHIESAGYAFVHGLGHGVGLEIHEPPRLRKGVSGSDTLLEPGMVITIEPGIYLPGVGGVRLEDTLVITNKGYTSLTKRPLNFD